MYNPDIKKYYEEQEGRTLYKISDFPLGYCYKLNENNKAGYIKRFFIEDGIEISIYDKFSRIERECKPKEIQGNTLEFCIMLDGETYLLDKNNDLLYDFPKHSISCYRFKNDLENFNMLAKNVSCISIYIDLDIFTNIEHGLYSKKFLKTFVDIEHKWLKTKPFMCIEADLEIIELGVEILSLPMINFLDYTFLKSKVFMLLSSLIKQISNHEKLSCYDEKIYYVKQRLEESIGNPPEIKELSEECGISIYKLQKGFKRHFNKTIYQYYKEIQIKYGKYLLDKSDKSILDISYEVGYENPSKFSASFKKIVGLTPSEYRKNRLIK